MADFHWEWVVSRAEELHVDTGSGSSSGFRFQANSTSAFSNELEFAAAKSVRTSIVILASFNAIAAFTAAAGIYWDCYASARTRDPLFKLKSSFWKVIGSAETFPFVLCGGIFTQAIIFAVAQSKGLEALMILGCAPISQSMLPATLVVPFIQIVFGLETTARALWRNPFTRRLRWTTTTCLAVVNLALFATVLVTRLDRAPNFCFASLFWFVSRWIVACFGVFIAAIAVPITAAVVIFFRLRKTVQVDPAERVSASWMVYFMAIAAVSNALHVPFFYIISFGDARNAVETPVQLSTVASVVSNLSGLITGALYLFLRSSRYATISPEGYFESDRQHLKKGIRLWAPNNFTYTNQMAQPVSPPAQYQRARSRQDEAGTEEQRVESPVGTPTYERLNPLGSNAVQTGASSPRKPPTAWAPAISSPIPFTRKESVTPINRAVVSVGKTFTLLPAATYIPASGQNPGEAAMPSILLAPPPALFGGDGGKHRRDSSMASSATVQIGLRLSNVNDMEPMQSVYMQEPNQLHELGCPDFRGQRASRKVSPLAINGVSLATANQGIDLNTKPLPVPRNLHEEDERPQDEEIRLSPTVYSPQQEKPRGRDTTVLGIGFNMITRASQPKPRTQDRKADWI